MSRAWHTFRDEATRICEQLGVNANDVLGLDIHIRVGEPVTVRVDMIASNATVKALADALKTITRQKASDEPAPVLPDTGVSLKMGS